jgi:hypothetical protein
VTEEGYLPGVPVCLVSVRGSAVRVRQGVFSVFFLLSVDGRGRERHTSDVPCTCDDTPHTAYFTVVDNTINIMENRVFH